MTTLVLLVLVATYNLLFAVWLGFQPQAPFEMFGMDPPWPDGISRALAGVIGLFALAYGYAAVRPRFARPVLILGLLSKIAPPIAWIVAVTYAGWPKSTFTLILCDDLIWWIPFAYVLAFPEPPGVNKSATLIY